jgi:hypothetical protein
MTLPKIPPRNIFLMLIILMVVSSGCARNPSEQAQPAPTKRSGQSIPTRLPQQPPSPLQTKTVSPTRPILSTLTSGSVPTSSSLPIGFGRQNPYPRSGIVSAPNWDVQILEVKRGEAAWKDLQSTNEFNEAPPEGMEYLMVKLHVKSTYADSDEHYISSCDFYVTGDHLIQYGCGAGAEFDPTLDASLTSGGDAEGWATYLIAQNEKKLMLVVNESFSTDENPIRYIALDEGASIGISQNVANIQPTGLGKMQNDPALRTEKVTTADWEISVSKVIRGDEAWTMVQDANQYNDPPTEGMEYLAVLIHVRKIGMIDKAQSMDASSFRTIGSAGIFYDSCTVDNPVPAMDISLYPGGEYEGWIVVTAAKGETGVMLVYKPFLDENDDNQRFIVLQP